MKCERCNINNATHHYKKSINGVVSEKYLCASCAAEENMPLKIFTGGVVFPPISFAPMNLAASQKDSARCSSCGTTLAEFNESAFLGCADCYNELRPYLEPVIKKLHGATQHTGKTPKLKGAESGRNEERTKLVRALERAISAEEFEEAARIRDQIREIDAR